MNTWRLLITPPSHGAWNMAVDEAILESVGSGDSLPTLRLYSWAPACLSLGYAQSFSDVDVTSLQRRGWEVVRRLTGGRAVLHTDEITYSVITPKDEPHVAGSLLESYNHLAKALVGVLHLLNVPVEVQTHTKSGLKNPNPVCFEVPSSSEITSGGRKLIGSAQRRQKEGILQHGSLPLTRVSATRLIERATTVEAVLGRVVSWSEAVQAFTSAFQSILALNLKLEQLTLLEEVRAEQLRTSKYAHPDWIQLR
jgi:lipoate-protein ligase A